MIEAPHIADATEMGKRVVGLVRANRLDEADAALQLLNHAYPETIDLLIFPVIIAIQRGRLTEAWQLVNSQAEDESPELRALCLRLLNDPTWHGYAEAGLEHPDSYVRSAMRNLLDRSEETDIHELMR